MNIYVKELIRSLLNAENREKGQGTYYSSSLNHTFN